MRTGDLPTNLQLKRLECHRPPRFCQRLNLPLPGCSRALEIEKSNIQTCIPPSENVPAAMPRVTAQNAGLRANPLEAARSGVSLSESNWPRGGSGNEQQGKSEQKARECRDVKGIPPSEMWTELAAQKISSGCTHGNCQIKHSKNAPVFILRKKISDEVLGRWSRRSLRQSQPAYGEPVAPSRCA